MKTKLQFGFTLVELIVTMAIIAILAGLMTGVFSTSQMRARDAVRKSDLKNVSAALEIMNSDYQRYPIEDKGNSPGILKACPYDVNETTQLSNGGVCMTGSEVNVAGPPKTTYMKEFPADPTEPNGKYYYTTVNNGSGYILLAHLENKNDNDCLPGTSGEPDCTNPAGIPAGLNQACGGAALRCNFAIYSSNASISDL